MTSDPRDDQAILSSKYSLVIAVAKRAREIVDRREQVLSSARKPVSVALDEIMNGKIQIAMKAEQPVAEEAPALTQEREPLL